MKKIIYISGLIISFLILNSNELNAQVYFGTNTVSATGTALGTSNTSNSSYTFASGYNTQVTNIYGFSHGYGAQAFGQYSASIGSFAYANGNRSYAIGENAKSTGTYSYSFGRSSQATGNYAFALGNYTTAIGMYGYAFGISSHAYGDFSFAFGRGAIANNDQSYCLGEHVSTSADKAYTIGRGLKTGSFPFETIHNLDNNISNSLMIGFNSDIATLFVGPSTGVGTFGKVGIATTSPIRTFDVNGMSHFADTMSIGTTKTNGSMLAVAGKISAEEVEVSLSTTWPDFVFSTSYELNTLAQVEEYINKHSHLPNVPSAEEVAEKGINIAEMDAILLQKIEELTLYTIAQQKQIDEQKKLIEEQSKLVEALIKEKK